MIASFVAFINGISEMIYRAIEFYGLSVAIESTFGISAIVFLCMFLVITSLDQQIASGDSTSRADWAFFAAALIMTTLPHPAFSWVALTMIGAREYLLSSVSTVRRRAATLILGITVPMFWGRLVFSLLSGWILQCDAVLVSLLTHSSRVGNVVDLPDHQGFLWIAAPCSSFANISLAVLCWLTFTAYSNRPRSRDDYVTCAFAILNVVIINVARISLLAKRPDLYDLIHGSLGSTIVSWLTAIVVFVTCAWGIKREPTCAGAADDGLSARSSAGHA